MRLTADGSPDAQQVGCHGALEELPLGRARFDIREQIAHEAVVLLLVRHSLPDILNARQGHQGAVAPGLFASRTWTVAVNNTLPEVSKATV